MVSRQTRAKFCSVFARIIIWCEHLERRCVGQVHQVIGRAKSALACSLLPARTVVEERWTTRTVLVWPLVEGGLGGCSFAHYDHLIHNSQCNPGTGSSSGTGTATATGAP